MEALTEPILIETNRLVAVLPGGFFGGIPVFADDIGIGPSVREWYEPIEDEL